MRKLAIIAAAMLVLFIFPTTIYALQNHPIDTSTTKPLEGAPETIAINFSATTPENARDAIISYIISRYNLNIEAPSSWTVTDTTPEGLRGYQTLQYTSGDWVVVVKHGITLTPIYSISVKYSGDNGFTWAGTLEMKISNEEYEPEYNNSDEPIYYSTEDARDMALRFLEMNHLDASVKLPSEWMESNLVPVGVVGASKIQYSSGVWKITVSAPVVWKPTYEIEVEYIGVNGFRWRGTLPTGGGIVETTFSKLA
jgi:hypothetical protein